MTDYYYLLLLFYRNCAIIGHVINKPVIQALISFYTTLYLFFVNEFDRNNQKCIRKGHE